MRNTLFLTSAKTGSEFTSIFTAVLPYHTSYEGALQLENMTAVHDDIGRKAVYWKTRLQPFNSAIVTVWTALSFQQSVYAGLAAYLCAFIVLL